MSTVKEEPPAPTQPGDRIALYLLVTCGLVMAWLLFEGLLWAWFRK